MPWRSVPTQRSLFPNTPTIPLANHLFPAGSTTPPSRNPFLPIIFLLATASIVVHSAASGPRRNASIPIHNLPTDHLTTTGDLTHSVLGRTLVNWNRLLKHSPGCLGVSLIANRGHPFLSSLPEKSWPHQNQSGRTSPKSTREPESARLLGFRTIPQVRGGCRHGVSYINSLGTTTQFTRSANLSAVTRLPA